MIFRIDREEGGAVPQVGTGIQLDGRSNVPRSAPPRLGEHSRAVLAGLLGYNDDKIRRLAADRII